MIRRVFTLLSALSMLLCVAAAALWARSQTIYDRVDHISINHDRLRVNILKARSFLGSFVLVRSQECYESQKAWDGMGCDEIYAAGFYHSSEPVFNPMRSEFNDSIADPRVLGFNFVHNVDAGWRYEDTLCMPFWFVLLLLALLPAWRTIKFLQGLRRHRQGLCRVCGYDLRATPGRCPECGAVPSSVKIKT
ncbi:MAG: hypothetical protein JWL69_4848 [Phycisphaerales bacterium]|nr:hypothetical protein [Phycisphaerales bacterium]MDB5354800.1 hypothetical protein [Phycisphaerales bacterium]